MDDGFPQKIVFLGPKANATNTHITIIAGANGTSKSRFLASIVDHFCELYDEISGKKISKRYGSSGSHGLICESVYTRGSAPRSQQNVLGSTLLPSKILVLSNLVTDRFRFVQHDADEGEFYQYLGVRQATNLMTTGSMQRSVSEAVMSLYKDERKRDLFQDWIKLVFGRSREVALTFDRISRVRLERYLSSENLEGEIIHRMSRFERSADSNEDRVSESMKKNAQSVIKLFKFMIEKAEDYKNTGKDNSSVKRLRIRLDKLRDSDLSAIAGLNFAFGAAIRGNFFPWPSISIGENVLSGWTDFGQLSSGEQNVLSTGAKLIAYAEPGCLIAIDEPEISLNTSWQQHFTDLVARSLSQAPGSHVLIATHSPHLIASLPNGVASVVLVEKSGGDLKTATVDANFEGWGAESILYQVLNIPSASSFKFQREMASVLLHIQRQGRDKKVIDDFLSKAERLNFDGAEALSVVVDSIKQYRSDL